MLVERRNVKSCGRGLWSSHSLEGKLAALIGNLPSFIMRSSSCTAVCWATATVAFFSENQMAVLRSANVFQHLAEKQPAAESLH